MKGNVAEEEPELKELSIIAVRRELEMLSEAALVRLSKVCSFIANRPDLEAKGITVDDLMNEAFGRMLTGERVWYDPGKVPFEQFFIGVVRSLVSHEGDRVKRECRFASDCDGEIPDGLVCQVTAEQQLVVKETLNRIEDLFSDDEIALMYLMARADGVPLSEMPDVFAVSKSEVEAARKRVSRNLTKIFSTEGYYDC